MPLPFNETQCQENCTSTECVSGCKFYSQIKNLSTTEVLQVDVNRKPKLRNDSVRATSRNTTSLSFAWSNIVTDGEPKLSSVYLISIRSVAGVNGYLKHQNVIGLSARNVSTVTTETVCSTYKNNFRPHRNRKYKLVVHQINYNGYDKDKFIESPYTDFLKVKPVTQLNVDDMPTLIDNRDKLSVRNKIVWNVTWSLPKDFNENLMKSVKVEVGFPQCTITQNHRVVSLFDYGPHLSTHPIKEQSMSFEFENTEKDELKSCTFVVKVTPTFGECLLGETTVKSFTYEGCHTVKDYGCSFVPTTTTPKPTDQPIASSSVTILPLRHKCQRYNQEICNGSISCKSCSEALYDVKVSWRKPQTASQIQHYVLRWGTGFVFGDLPFISKEKKRTHVDPDKLSHIFRDIPVSTPTFTLIVQVYAETSTKGPDRGYAWKDLTLPTKKIWTLNQTDEYVSSGGFFALCSNNFIPESKTNQRIPRASQHSINEQWFKWARLYSYCTQYASIVLNISSKMDMDCESFRCRNCMRACHVPLPFDGEKCLNYCDSDECINGCTFYQQILNTQDVAYDEATNADTEKSDIEIVKQNINNITFRWNNVTVNNLQNVSNIYLVVLQVSNKFYTNAQNVLGLTARTDRVITMQNICSTYKFYGKYRETQYKLNVYAINHRRYDKNQFLSSNFTKLKPFNALSNITIHSPTLVRRDNTNWIRWNVSLSVVPDTVSTAVLPKRFEMKTSLHTCMNRGIRRLIPLQAIKFLTYGNGSTHFEYQNTARDELASCTGDVEVKTLLGDCLLGGTTSTSIIYEGCHTVDNYDCADVATTTARPYVPTDQPLTQNMMNATIQKKSCISYTETMCIPGNDGFICRSCSKASYNIRVEWQRPFTHKKIEQYFVRWGDGTPKVLLDVLGREYNRTTTIDTFYDIKDIEIEGAFTLAIQVSVNTVNRDSTHGYFTVQLKGPQLAFPILARQPAVPGKVDAKKNLTLIITLPLVFLLLSFIVLMLLHHRRRKKTESVVVSRTHADKNIYVNQNSIKYDGWEINSNDIKIGNRIGSGAFGTVFSATINTGALARLKYAKKIADSVLLSQQNLKVAVKILKDGSPVKNYDIFKEEFKIMKSIGYHKNILNYIGCSTITDPHCIVTEFMENGDLLQYLRDRRLQICSTKSSVSGNNQSFIFTQQYLNTLKQADDTHVITPRVLLSFAWQVACGMEYLSNKKFIHRDLACRNILVGVDHVVKISDFSLTKEVSLDAVIQETDIDEKLPVKWMSPEALLQQISSTCSDVWAYGVVLYEIVTLGEAPYPGLSNYELLEKLKAGYRMEKPENCSKSLYDIMQHCWNETPLQRPSFKQLRILFCNVLNQESSEDKENHYYNLQPSCDCDEEGDNPNHTAD